VVSDFYWGLLSSEPQVFHRVVGRRRRRRQRRRRSRGMRGRGTTGRGRRVGIAW
jgi:hypothetical protein